MARVCLLESAGKVLQANRSVAKGSSEGLGSGPKVDRRSGGLVCPQEGTGKCLLRERREEKGSLEGRARAHG
jgi:hypothetical protein